MHALLTQEELKALQAVISNGSEYNLGKSKSPRRRRMHVVLADRKCLPKAAKVASLREILTRPEIDYFFKLFRQDKST
jgi:hypothetical protein